MERIAKVLARRTGLSRRKAEEFVLEKRVKVNGEIVLHPSEKVSLGANISIDDQQIAKYKAPEIWLFHKPPKYETTRLSSSGKDTIYDLLPERLQELKYIGRLDYMSEGLIVLTNDGEIIDSLTRAKNKIEKTYLVHCYSKMDSEELLDTLNSAASAHNELYRIERARIKSCKNNQYELEIVLTEGKNREVRNILSYYDVRISRLIRTKLGPYSLGKLKPGHYGQIKVDQNENNRR